MEWDELVRLLNTHHYTGIGVLTGATSGNAELIEIEGPMDAAALRLNAVIAQATSDTWASLELGDLLSRIARGCVEKSAGDGLHLFIRVVDGPAKPNTKLAMIGQGTDRKVIAETRGEGGFVVVAPTPGRNGHPEGAAYMFINGGAPENTVEVTSEERDLLHLLFTEALDEPDQAEIAAMLAQQAAATSKPTTATSSDPGAFDAYRTSVTWQSILEPAGWTWSHRDADRDHWVRPGKNKTEGTSATTIEDGPMYVFSTNAGLPVETGLSKAQVYAHLHHGGDLSAAAKALQAAGYGQPSGPQALPAWEAVLDPDASDEEKAEAATTWVHERLPLLDWHAVWADTTEEEWLVEPLLARRRLIALYSAPKVGKSLLMLEIAAALATGRPVLGNTPVEPIKTLYVDFENDPKADVRERLESMNYKPDDLGNLCYLSFPTLAKLDTKAGADELMAAIAVYQCEVVVIDTVSRAVQGEENENDTWLNFYRHTGLRLKQAGVALIRLDHAGKDETKGQRGGSAKSGDVDAVWRLSKISDEFFRLVCEANRFPVTEKVIDMQRVTDGVLRHKRDMDAKKKITDEIIGKFAEAKVPRDESVGVRQAIDILKAAGITFTKAQVTKASLAEYRRRMPTWTTPEMGSE
jgi:hypothetical protein